MPRVRPFAPVLLAATILAVPSPSDACAPTPPRNVVVEVAFESAIIVWDAPNKTQHFIRRAAFNVKTADGSPVKDFGFLVPTPSQPALEEVDDAAFNALAKVTAPKTETQKQPKPGCAGGGGCGSTPSAPSGKVSVLDEKRVAGYDAAVLKATDAEALAKWLKDHEYESRPALTEWLKTYVEKNWVITAFKIARDPGAPKGVAVGSTAVRMSFVTDAPFFPYHEPTDVRAAGTKRLLRVFFLGDKRMAGKLGGAAWPGAVAWAGPLPAEGAKNVAPLLKIPGYTPTEQTWLTEFEDHSSPRPGTADVTFSPDPDQTPVERPKNIIYVSQADAAGKAAFAIFAMGIAGVYLLPRFRFTPKSRA